MINVSNLCLKYGTKPIMDNVSFSAEAAQITIILGKNGCGKSTLMRAITGNLRYKGSIQIDGCEVSETAPSLRAKLLSLMPQMLARPSITVRELVSYGRQPYTGISGILSKNDWALVDNTIDKIGLTSLSSAYANRISGGELQKAYLAMTLVQNTQNILLDEPCAHLDLEYESRMSEFLIKMKTEGRTILAVFHNINRAVELADRLIVIGDRKILFNGNTAEFIESETAIKSFGLKQYCCIDENGCKKFFFA